MKSVERLTYDVAELTNERKAEETFYDVLSGFDPKCMQLIYLIGRLCLNFINKRIHSGLSCKCDLCIKMIFKMVSIIFVNANADQSNISAYPTPSPETPASGVTFAYASTSAGPIPLSINRCGEPTVPPASNTSLFALTIWVPPASNFTPVATTPSGPADDANKILLTRELGTTARFGRTGNESRYAVRESLLVQFVGFMALVATKDPAV